MPELATKGSGTCAAIMLKRTLLAPKVARAFVRDALSIQDIAGDMIEDACLVAVELVTNVVRHVPTADEMRLCVSMNLGRPVIEVWDPSPVPPVVAEEDPDAESGRGLRDVVANLSTSWHYTICPQDEGAGKIVGAFI